MIFERYVFISLMRGRCLLDKVQFEAAHCLYIVNRFIVIMRNQTLWNQD